MSLWLLGLKHVGPTQACWQSHEGKHEKTKLRPKLIFCPFHTLQEFVIFNSVIDVPCLGQFNSCIGYVCVIKLAQFGVTDTLILVAIVQDRLCNGS